MTSPTIFAMNVDGATPGVTGPDILPHQRNFTVLDDGLGDQPITIAYYTSDVSP